MIFIVRFVFLFSISYLFWLFRRNESFLRILKDISWPKFPFCSESQLLTWLFNPWKNFSILLLLVTLVTLLKAVMLSLMFQISSRFFTCVWSRDLTSFYWNINHQALAEKPVLVGSPHDDQKKIVLLFFKFQNSTVARPHSVQFCWRLFADCYQPPRVQANAKKNFTSFVAIFMTLDANNYALWTRVYYTAGIAVLG